MVTKLWILNKQFLIVFLLSFLVIHRLQIETCQRAAFCCVQSRGSHEIRRRLVWLWLQVLVSFWVSIGTDACIFRSQKYKPRLTKGDSSGYFWPGLEEYLVEGLGAWFHLLMDLENFVVDLLEVEFLLKMLFSSPPTLKTRVNLGGGTFRVCWWGWSLSSSKEIRDTESELSSSSDEMEFRHSERRPLPLRDPFRVPLGVPGLLLADMIRE